MYEGEAAGSGCECRRAVRRRETGSALHARVTVSCHHSSPVTTHRPSPLIMLLPVVLVVIMDVGRDDRK